MDSDFWEAIGNLIIGFLVLASWVVPIVALVVLIIDSL